MTAELADWNNFYLIVGSAAGGLIGLQFVVLTQIAQQPPRRGAEGSAAFATPTVVHFATVLLLAAAMCAPWRAIAPVAVIWGTIVGASGVSYALVVIRRMRRQSSYMPALLLLFIGIHHAWDAVVYHVFVNMAKPRD